MLSLLMSALRGSTVGAWLHKGALAAGGLSALALYFFIRGKRAGRARDAQRRVEAITTKREIDRHVERTVGDEQALSDLLSGRGYDSLRNTR